MRTEFLCIFVFSIAITLLGADRTNLSSFMYGLFDLCLFGFVRLFFVLVSGKGCVFFLSLNKSLFSLYLAFIYPHEHERNETTEKRHFPHTWM